MTDLQDTLAKYRIPWRRDQLKQAGALAPYLRYAKANPALLIGAAAVGIAGFFAWRNREKIAATAAPLIGSARTRGQDLLDSAKTRSSDLVDAAKAKGQGLVDGAKDRAEAIGEKATALRRRAAGETLGTDVH